MILIALAIGSMYIIFQKPLMNTGSNSKDAGSMNITEPMSLIPGKIQDQNSADTIEPTDSSPTLVNSATLPGPETIQSIRPGYDLETNNTNYQAYFKNNSNSKDGILFIVNGYNFSFDISTSQMKWYNSTLNAEVGMISPMNPQDTNASANGSTVDYDNAWVNTSLSYSLGSNMIKETLTVQNVSAKSSGVGVDYLQYKSNNFFNNSLQVCADNKCFLHPSNQRIDTNGTIEFRNSTNETQFYLPQPIVTDSSGAQANAYYSAQASNGVIVVAIRIPKSFIDNATWPIFVDPSLVSNASSYVNHPTTSGINTTGATLLIVGESCFSISPCNAPTDSNNNTWHSLTQRAGMSGGTEQMWYAYDKNGSALSVGNNHTFTGDTNVYGMIVEAFSGTKTTADPLDSQNGSSITSAVSGQPGNITPSENNELLVTYMGAGGSASQTYQINQSFNITNQVGFTGSVTYGQGMAYLVETSAATQNPTWNWTSSMAAGITIAAFKSASTPAFNFTAFTNPANTTYTNASSPINLTINYTVQLNGKNLSQVWYNLNGSATINESYTEQNFWNTEPLASSEWHAQSFTIGNRGTNQSFVISTLSVHGYRDTGSPGPFNASIRNVNSTGQPTGPDLSTGYLNASSIGNTSTGEWINISMSPYTLNASTQYALVIWTNTTGSNQYIMQVDEFSSTYTGGKYMESSDQGATFSDFPFTSDEPFIVTGQSSGVNVTIGYGNATNSTFLAYLGYNNMTLGMNATDGTYNQTSTTFFTIAQSATNSCTPSNNTQWDLNCADNCSFNGASLTITNWIINSTGTGQVNFTSSAIKYQNLTYGKIASTCTINKNPSDNFTAKY